MMTAIITRQWDDGHICAETESGRRLIVPALSGDEEKSHQAAAEQLAQNLWGAEPWFNNYRLAGGFTRDGYVFGMVRREIPSRHMIQRRVAVV